MRNIKNSIAVLLALVALFFGAQSAKTHQSTSRIARLHTLAGDGFAPREATKNHDCVLVAGLPDSGCTPGAVFPDVVRGDICNRSYGSTVKSVTTATKSLVFAAYGIPDAQKSEYQIDRLISVNLGGSNEIANLWPQVAKGALRAGNKNQVETYLNDKVCAGVLSTTEAQKLIANHWQEVYKLMR